MRTSSKLLLAATAAFAAFAFATASASARSPIELQHENGVHCSPCLVHVVSESPTALETHLFGSEQLQSQCTDSFTAEFNEDGTGSIHNQVLSGPNCTRQACDSAAESEWLTPSAGEEIGPGQARVPVRFCLEPVGGGTEQHCTVDLIITEVALHDYEIRTNDDCSGFPTVEIDSHWFTERDEDFEIVHLI